MNIWLDDSVVKVMRETTELFGVGRPSRRSVSANGCKSEARKSAIGK